MAVIWMGTGRFAVPWTPAAITTALWLDAGDVSTVTTVSGAVSEWRDKSGNTRNATQSTAGSRPAYSSTSFNLKPGLTFDGGSDFLIADGLASIANGNDTPFSVFFALNAATTSAFRTIIGFGSSAGIDYYHTFDLTADNFIRSARRQVFATDGDKVVIGSSVVSGSNQVVSAVFSGTSVEILINGSSHASGAQNSGDMGNQINRFSIGARRRSAVELYASMVMSELIVTANSASTDTRQRIEGYLAHKWGLTANLPADHPYKSAAPTL